MNHKEQIKFTKTNSYSKKKVMILLNYDNYQNKQINTKKIKLIQI